MSERVLTSHDDGVATVTVNRPEKRNAMDIPTRRALRDAIETGVDRDDCRVLVVRGAGDGSFIAGGDLEAFAGFDPVDALNYLDHHSQGLYNYLAEVRVPTVAAIDGYAFGGGMELALACDFRVATESATLGVPEVGLGLIPGGGGTQRLAHAAGSTVAKDLVLTGRSIDAREAADLRVLTDVYPDERFEAELESLVETLRDGAPVAQRLGKLAVNRALGSTEGFDVERLAAAFLFATEDLAEGVSAFRDDRDPTFRGR